MEPAGRVEQEEEVENLHPLNAPPRDGDRALSGESGDWQLLCQLPGPMFSLFSAVGFCRWADTG